MDVMVIYFGLTILLQFGLKAFSTHRIFAWWEFVDEFIFRNLCFTACDISFSVYLGKLRIMWHISRPQQKIRKNNGMVIVLNTWWRKGSNVSLAFATAITQAVLISRKRKKWMRKNQKIKKVCNKSTQTSEQTKNHQYLE